MSRCLNLRRRLNVDTLEERTAPSIVPVGGEFRANTYTTASQLFPKVAMDQAGDVVAAWASNGQDGSRYGVYAQRYNAAGITQGAEFRVNTYTTNNQNKPAVAMDQAGDFVVVWQSGVLNSSQGIGQDGSYYGVYAQRYNSAGQPQGGEFRVNTYTYDDQRNPAVAMDQAGDFVVTWDSKYQENGIGGQGVYAQRYNSAGAPQGGEFHVNTYTTFQQYSASVAMDFVGDFVVAWASNGQDGNYDGVYAQRYGSTGAVQGPEFRVNTYTTSYQNSPAVAMDQAGDFVVVWESVQDGSGYGVYAQRYDSAGTPQGGEFRVNSYTSLYQFLPVVAMDQAGDFVVAWSSDGQDGSNSGVYAQVYRVGGLPDGGEFRVNTYTTSDQVPRSVAMDAAGDTIVAWDCNGQDGSLFGAYAQRFKLAQPPQVSGTQINDGTAQRSRVTSLKVTFNAQVNFAGMPGAAFTLTRNSDSAAVGFTATANVVGGVTVVTLNSFIGGATEFGSLADGRYTLTALATQISAGGSPLDGNGDGTGGDNYTLVGDPATNKLFRLFGDADGGGTVDALDFGAFLSAFGTGPGIFDFDNGGATDAVDFGQFLQRFGTGI